MEGIHNFLRSSTIHGLQYLSVSNRLSRIFWALVVTLGFTMAGYLIHLSFDTWRQSPISTTIETLPISQMTLPYLTVCPPKTSLLNLNYDIVHSEEVDLDNVTRKELFGHVLEVIQDEYYTEMMKNLSKVNDTQKYYNWYHGHTKITYPFYKTNDNDNQLAYKIHISSSSGNISTQYFGENFDVDKVDGSIYIWICVYVPNIITSA